MNSAEDGSLASALALQLLTCFAFGVCSPVTFLRKLTCLAGLGLRERENLQEMGVIAAWPGLEGKTSQTRVCGLVTVFLVTV